ncbi:hypothetical protein TrCOL_g4453 [Triparma columacea]|uniref:Uncharacterized protein n=1 Tax=Triparma columacea TaxID=722753 RepID=A0A9W7GNM6_9STRA|nr:hypothetical protein TrCOL_g4453 [Triparma columacea]
METASAEGKAALTWIGRIAFDESKEKGWLNRSGWTVPEVRAIPEKEWHKIDPSKGGLLYLTMSKMHCACCKACRAHNFNSQRRRGLRAINGRGDEKDCNFKSGKTVAYAGQSSAEQISQRYTLGNGGGYNVFRNHEKPSDVLVITGKGDQIHAKELIANCCAYLVSRTSQGEHTETLRCNLIQGLEMVRRLSICFKHFKLDVKYIALKGAVNANFPSSKPTEISPEEAKEIQPDVVKAFENARETSVEKCKQLVREWTDEYCTLKPNERPIRNLVVAEATKEDTRETIMTRRKVTEEKETEEKEMRAKAIERDNKRIVRAAANKKGKRES